MSETSKRMGMRDIGAMIFILHPAEYDAVSTRAAHYVAFLSNIGYVLLCIGGE